MEEYHGALQQLLDGQQRLESEVSTLGNRFETLEIRLDEMHHHFVYMESSLIDKIDTLFDAFQSLHDLIKSTKENESAITKCLENHEIRIPHLEDTGN